MRLGKDGAAVPEWVHPFHQLLEDSPATGSWWRTFLQAACREGHPRSASRAGLQPAGCQLEGVGIPALSGAPGDACSPRTHF